MQLEEATSPSTAATESATVAPVAQQKPVYDPTVTYTKTGERYVRKKKKEKWLAIVLCVAFGIFGAHRFYEGKKRSGILYLCTLGLLFCGVVYDFIQLLSRPEYYYP
ncbi:MAG: TM2 domain-containing protein, partial [Clostridia bacterium]|nr:TM2 domain-containing protein [Clostridia bacterium]